MIGLFTPFKILNYGTKLQAFAVQEVIRNYGDVEVIDYSPSLTSRLIHKPESLHNMRYMDQQPHKKSLELDNNTLTQRNQALESFDSLYIKSPSIVGKSRLTSYAAKHYGSVVCGSDQIWNPVNLARHVFMLEFVPKHMRKVAFSPSFGLQRIPPSLEATYRRRLKNIDFLSVREESGVNILRDLGFNEVTWTLDPTLVLDSAFWGNLASPPSSFPYDTNEPFLFCYFLGVRKIERETALRIAQQKKLRIVTLPHFKGHVQWDEQFGDCRLFNVTPQNFVWLIQNASAVCTDSFHGCAFSLQFERELYCVRRHSSTDIGTTNERVTSLLSEFDLTQRIIEDGQDVKEVVNASSNYSQAQARLLNQRSVTRSFLSRALGGRK